MKPNCREGVISKIAKTPTMGIKIANWTKKIYKNTSIKKPKGFCLKSQMPWRIQM
jgi:hypothetical protein